MPYMVTITINIPQMLPYMAYMDPMGYITLYNPRTSMKITSHRSNSTSLLFGMFWGVAIPGCPSDLSESVAQLCTAHLCPEDTKAATRTTRRKVRDAWRKLVKPWMGRNRIN